MLCISIVFLVSSLITSNSQAWKGTFPTGISTCDYGCFKKSDHVNCLSNDFKSSTCCNYPNNSEDQKNCMKNHKFCTKGLKVDRYKYLTCPMHKCPEYNSKLEVKHTKLYKP